VPDATHSAVERVHVGDGVDAQAIATRLGRVAHAGLVPIERVVIEGDTLVVVTRVIEGHPIADEPRAFLTDKVVALGTELLPALTALADQGLAHGRLDARRVLRRDDGSLVVAGATGLTDDGRAATPDDDARALVSLLIGALPEKAPAVTRAGLEALLAEAVPLAGLHTRLVAVRAAIPIPKGRQIRSIKRLAFPPAPISQKRSKRYLVRVLLTAAVVGLGLYVAFDVAEGKPADAAPTPVVKAERRGDVLYVTLPPLPPKP